MEGLSAPLDIYRIMDCLKDALVIDNYQGHRFYQVSFPLIWAFQPENAIAN